MRQSCVAVLALAVPLAGWRAPLAGWRAPDTRFGRAGASRMAAPSVADLVVAASDGDIVAGLGTAALGIAAASAVAAAWSLVADEPPPPPPPRRAPSDKVAVTVDLGADGEPAGPATLFLRPVLPRSDIVQLELRTPLGLLIEETDDGTIVVGGALPGFSAIGRVEPGDILRAVTAYATVVAGAPMWAQVASGTPMGTAQLKRLIFTTDGAAYADVKDAIASCRPDAGGSGVVSLVVERAVNASTPLAPRVAADERLEPLQVCILRRAFRFHSRFLAPSFPCMRSTPSVFLAFACALLRRPPCRTPSLLSRPSRAPRLQAVLARDLRLPPAPALGEEELAKLGPAERARRLFGDE